MVSPKRLWERLEMALERDANEQAERILDTLREEAPDSSARSWGEIAWCYHQDDEPGAEAGLRSHLERWADDPDALHALGALLVEGDGREEGIALWKRVRSLDVAADEAAGVGGEDDERFVVDVARQVLEDLPEKFSEALTGVPVLVEARPSEEVVAEGFDPRALGLFEGPTQEEREGLETPPAPTRIVLYIANLSADAPEDDQLADEVEITLLHEIGHYFGLDEEEVEALGLA